MKEMNKVTSVVCRNQKPAKTFFHMEVWSLSLSTTETCDGCLFSVDKFSSRMCESKAIIVKHD
jgi:hypothetical protein